MDEFGQRFIEVVLYKGTQYCSSTYPHLISACWFHRGAGADADQPVEPGPRPNYPHRRGQGPGCWSGQRSS